MYRQNRSVDSEFEISATAIAPDLKSRNCSVGRGNGDDQDDRSSDFDDFPYPIV